MSWHADRSEVVPGTTSNQVTELLDEGEKATRKRWTPWLPLVYDELRRVAHNHLPQERPAHIDLGFTNPRGPMAQSKSKSA